MKYLSAILFVKREEESFLANKIYFFVIENVRSTHYERIGKTIIIYFCKYSVRYNRPALKVVSLPFFLTLLIY